MRIEYHRRFKKNFQKRVAENYALSQKFEERLRLLLADRTNQVLYNHRLKGKRNEYWSFAITGDIRVIYKIEGGVLRLYDIGSHNQVY